MDQARGRSEDLIALLGAAALVIVAVLVVYSRTFSAPFQFDDQSGIVENQALQHVERAGEIFRYKPSRFLGYWSLAASWAISGKNPLGYHLFSVVEHLISALALLWFLYLLMEGLDWPKRESAYLAGFGALVFALHPLQTEAVTYIVQRLELQQGMFALLSAAFYLAARLRAPGERLVRMPFYLLSLLFFVFAVFTKEPSFTLPFMLGAVEVLIVQRKRPAKRAFYLFMPYLAMALALAVMVKMQGSVPDSSATVAGRSRYVIYGLTQLKAHLLYLRLVALPYGQSVDHYFPSVKSIDDPWALAGAAVLAALLAVAFVFRRRQPLISLAILWYFLALAVSSSVIPILDNAVEHRLYAALAGYAMVLVLAASLIKRPRVRCAVCAAAVLVYGAAAFARNEVWLSPEKLWADAVRKGPRKSRPKGNLAGILMNRGANEEALRLLADAADPAKTEASEVQRSMAFDRLGTLYLKLKEPAKAEECLRKAIEHGPTNALAHYNLGMRLLTRAGEESNEALRREALRTLERAMDLTLNASANPPKKSVLYAYYGRLFAQNGLEGLAIERLEAALAADSEGGLQARERAEIANQLGGLYRNAGDLEKADNYFKKSAEYDPNYAPPYYNLGVELLARANRLRDKDLHAQAIKCLERAVDLKEDYSEAHYYLGVGLMYRPESAREHLLKAIETDKSGPWAAKARELLEKLPGKNPG